MRTTKCVNFKSLLGRLTPEDRERRLTARVYKYFDRSIEDLILQKGSIRIGTAAGYRKHPLESVRDDREGVISTAINKVFLSSGTPTSIYAHPTSPFSGWLNQNVGPVVNGDIYLEGLEVRAEFDAYVYSFSYELSAQVASSFQSSPYDAVAEITDIFGLAETLISIHPDLKGLYYCVSPVIYFEGERTPLDVHANPIVQMFEKRSLFANNREGRIVFFGEVIYQDRLLALPADFQSPEIRRWFRKASIPKMG